MFLFGWAKWKNWYYSTICYLKQETKTWVFLYTEGASACVELQKYDDAVRWCDDGLAVSLCCEVFGV